MYFEVYIKYSYICNSDLTHVFVLLLTCNCST